MRWRVIVVKTPVTTHARVIPKILFKISQTVVFGIPRSLSSSRTVNRRSPAIASRTRLMFSGVVVSEGRPERGSLSTDLRPFLNRLYLHTENELGSLLAPVQGVCEGLLVTLIPRRGQSSALARRYKHRSDTFRTHLVCLKAGGLLVKYTSSL